MDAYTLPNLTFDHGALEPHLSARIIELHHDKHHRGYVDGANATIERLGVARRSDDFSAIVGLEKTLAFNVSGHVLHSIYWRSLSADGGGEPAGELGAAIADQFGSFATFKKHMTQVTATVQGSGWSVLSWEPLGRRLLIEQIADHQSNTLEGATPLLVIDAWERAYYLQYENRRPEYVEAIWNVIGWSKIEEVFDGLSKV